MDGNTNTNVQDIIDEHFIKSIDSILIAKHRKINIMNSLEYKALEKMYIAKNHFNKEKSIICIDIPKPTEELRNTENLESHHIINDNRRAEPIKKNKFIQKQVIQNEKMPTCGTWFDGCCNCCYMPLKCMDSSRYLSSKCCRIFTNRLKQLYFFMLYLFTGELNTEAVGYKNYFNVTTIKDDQVNIPEIIITATSIVFELYKTLIGSFLTVFTSQRCGQQTCTIWENIVPKNDLELAGIIFNFLMATTLLIEYIFEIMREAYLIKYLKYDKSLANNGEHIAELYETADKDIFTKLIPLYIIYIRFSYVVLFVYFVNVILSAVIVSENYYDNTSIFSFITNALFIIYKIYNVVEITSYRGDYFYSAYKKKNIHYNTIKPKYLFLPEVPENIDLITPDQREPPAALTENIVVDIENQATENIVVDIENQATAQESGVIDSIAILNLEHSPKKTILSHIEDGEDLSQSEKEEVIHDLYAKKYIDKKVYRKLSLFLRKSEYGGVELSDA